MFLKEKIQQDLKEAQLSKNEAVLSVLRMLLAAINNKEIEKRTRLSKTEPIEKLNDLSKLSDEEILDVISSEAKKRKEAAMEYEKGKRDDLASKEKQELEILQKYLPEQLSEEEMVKIAKEAVAKTGSREIKDMGRVMAELSSKIKGKADGSHVSKIVKELLSKI